MKDEKKIDEIVVHLKDYLRFKAFNGERSFNFQVNVNDLSLTDVTEHKIRYSPKQLKRLTN